ncbi:anti-sigma factor family protein [Thermoactinospora rubra]|uniref:anti-sigma factor family protein n=1 Tax=Thermoactinospora rubra TaxID=1088767 RepID=UPI000A0FF8B4|nr:anti-sigma factor [Thermoactinospora rubra]
MMTCEEVRLSLGAHALGALEPDEAAEVDAHLAACESCLEEFTSLSTLPAFLAKVSEQDVELVARPPRQVLDRLLATRARRNRVGRALMGVAAAAAAVVVAATVWNAERGAEQAATTGAQAPASAESAPSVYSLQQEQPADRAHDRAQTKVAPDESRWVGEGEQVTAVVSAMPSGRGARLTVTVTGLPPESTCRLVVIGDDGSRHPTASWTIEPEYRESSFETQTTVALGRIAAFRLEDARGKLLANIPVTGGK